MTFETNQRFIRIGFVAILLMIPTHYFLTQVQAVDNGSEFFAKVLNFLFTAEQLCAVFLFGIYGWLARFQSTMLRGYDDALHEKRNLHWDGKLSLRKLNVSKVLGLWVEKPNSQYMKYMDKN